MISRSQSSLIHFTPAIGWGILICYFSLLPQNEVPQMLLSVRDFLLHFAIYAALSLLIAAGFNRFTWSKIPHNQVLNSIVACTVLGVLLEVVQETLVAGRHFQWSDILFNTLGILLILPVNRFMLK